MVPTSIVSHDVAEMTDAMLGEGIVASGQDISNYANLPNSSILSNP